MNLSIAMSVLLLTAAVAPAPAAGQAGPSRKALVVGIDRYDAQRGAKGRGALRRLYGAVADANAMAGLLRDKLHFDDVQVLTDEHATRDGILAAIKKTLVDGTRPGDVRVFSFSGHGGQVGNEGSRELDKLDETIVPYDHSTALDLRDKELSRELGRVVDAGGVLTVVLDSCHSGGAVRGKPEDKKFKGVPKVAALDPRTVSDPDVPVPPEQRGALVVSAALDLESALEVNTPAPRGALTFALVEALSDDDAREEPAQRIFLRAQERMKALTSQTPVLAGTLQRQRETFFEAGPAKIGSGDEVPARRNGDDIEVEAFGLGVGTVLARAAKGPELELELTRLDGPTKSYARVSKGDAASLRDGELFKILTWAAPPGSNLVVHVPDGVDDQVLRERVADLQALRGSGRVEWVDDPADSGPGTYGLAWEATKQGPRWILYPPDGKLRVLTPKELRAWKPAAGTKPRIAATLPPPEELAKELRERWRRPGGLVAVTSSRPDAHYRLVGRVGSQGAAEYAWSRAAKLDSGPPSALSARSDYATAAAAQGAARGAASALGSSAEDIARAYAWFALQSRPESDERFPYRLALRREDGTLRHDGDEVRGGEVYGLVLEPDGPANTTVEQRNVYVFAVDAWGQRTVLFPPPTSGDVENLLPLPKKAGEPIVLGTEPIPLGSKPLFRVGKPFGTDTYFVFASETKLPRYREVLNARGFRTRGPGERGPYADALPLDLLAPAMGTRGTDPLAAPVPTRWTVRRIAIKSVEQGP